MKKIKRAYYYIFYKIYKSIIYTSEMVGGEFWTAFKAGIALFALELLFLGSLLNYYSIIINTKLKITITSPIILILCIINYFSLIHTDIWKQYYKEFDILPEERNKKGSLIVWTIAALIFINYCGSAYYLQKYVLKMY